MKCNIRNSPKKKKEKKSAKWVFRLFCSSLTFRSNLEVPQFIESSLPAVQRDPETRSCPTQRESVCTSDEKQNVLTDTTSHSTANNQHVEQTKDVFSLKTEMLHLFIQYYSGVYWGASRKEKNPFTQYNLAFFWEYSSSDVALHFYSKPARSLLTIISGCGTYN